jgi:hypothetical protein
MKHTHTSQKATIARVGEGWVNAYLSNIPWVRFIRKLKTTMPMQAKRKIIPNEG